MAKKLSVIDKLRDDNEYYRGIGREYLSNSDVGALLNNPAAFKAFREDNKSFAEGRYFHQLILEPDKAKNVPYVDASSRLTNVYKQYIAENNVEVVLLRSEKEHIEYLVSIIKKNITFFDEIYRHDNKFEEPNVGNIFGLDWKGKADILCTDCIIDLKTTSDIMKFKYSAKSYNYDSQCYIYQELFGRPLIFYAIDKGTGQLGIFTPSDEFVRGGQYKVERAVEQYNKYFGPDKTDDVENYYINETL